MKQLTRVMFASVGLLLSCNRTNTSVNEVKDMDMTFQVTEIKDKAPGDESLTYKARLIPSKELAANETISQKKIIELSDG